MKKLCLFAILVATGFSAVAQNAAAKPDATAKPAVGKPDAAKPAAGKPDAAAKPKKPGAMSLVDARGMIDAVVADKTGKTMRKVMKKLSAEDQLLFLADVNKAIADLPASIEEKTALFLNFNHAALAVAEKGNVTPLLAEVFATVPPEALTVICEKFATDLLNRSGDARVTYTDAEFTQMAETVVKAVAERTSELDNCSARTAFAIIMFIRASNGTPEDLAEKLIDLLPTDEARELAKNEWIPSALGKDGREQGYEPLLASADAGRRPDFDFVLVIAGPQYLDSILHDIGGKNVDAMSFIRTRTPVLDAVENPLANQIPDIGTGAVSDGNVPAPPPNEPRPTPPEPTPPEPRPYNGQ